MAVSPRQQKKDDLCRLLAQTGDPGDIAALLDDLCTLKEIENMSERRSRICPSGSSPPSFCWRGTPTIR